MKKLAVMILSLSVLAVLSTAALAECKKDCCKDAAASKEKDSCKASAASKDPTAQEVVIDPTCGMDVTVKDAKYSYEYKDKTYYFCSKNCMDSFAKDPSKFLSKESK